MVPCNQVACPVSVQMRLPVSNFILQLTKAGGDEERMEVVVAVIAFVRQIIIDCDGCPADSRYCAFTIAVLEEVKKKEKKKQV